MKIHSDGVVVTVNGDDVSKYAALDDDEPFKGMKRVKDVVISGFWADARETCAVCHERYQPGPEGVAHLTMNGQRIGPVCYPCGVAMVAPKEAES